MTPTDPVPSNQPQSSPTPTIEFPRYRSHKIVQAARIMAVQRETGEGAGADLIIDPGEGRDQMVWRVTAQYVQKHDPQPGGWYVRYVDGYESFSPAAAFEQGYARHIDPPLLEVRRTIETHKVNHANAQLRVDVLDDPGPGGANHLFEIRGFSSGSNPSDPWTGRYGKPAEHSTLLFQNGGIAEVGVNGLTHEVLLAIIVDRIAAFQAGPYACRENEKALEHLHAAIGWLEARTARRQTHGVEGTLQLDPKEPEDPLAEEAEQTIEEQLDPLIQRIEKLHEADRNDVAYATIRGHLHTCLRWAQQRTERFANQANVQRK